TKNDRSKNGATVTEKPAASSAGMYCATRKRQPAPSTGTGESASIRSGLLLTLSIRAPAEQARRRNRRPPQLRAADPAGEIVLVVVEPNRRCESIEPIGVDNLKRIVRVEAEARQRQLAHRAADPGDSR